MRLLLALLIALAACGKSEPQLDDYGAMPSFAFRDQTGGAISDEWLRGHVTIVDFIFTRCDTICPALTFQMARLETQTRDLGDRLRFLSFTVDPAHDTPEVLAAYAARNHADAARWRFVTGDYRPLEALIEGALMTAMDPAGTTASGAPDIRHGGHFLLIDGDLHIRGIYDSTEQPRMEALVRDARRLAD